MENWIESGRTPWNLSQIRRWDGQSFQTFNRRRFWVQLDRTPEHREVVAFISAKGYKLHEHRLVSQDQGRYTFEAYVAKV